MRKVVLTIPDVGTATINPEPSIASEHYDFYELVPGKIYLGEIINFEWKRIEK